MANHLKVFVDDFFDAFPKKFSEKSKIKNLANSVLEEMAISFLDQKTAELFNRMWQNPQIRQIASREEFEEIVKSSRDKVIKDYIPYKLKHSK